MISLSENTFNDVSVTSCSVNSKDDDATSLCSITDEPIHILNIAIVTEKGIDDDSLSKQFHEYVQEHKVSVIIRVGRFSNVHQLKNRVPFDRSATDQS